MPKNYDGDWKVEDREEIRELLADIADFKGRVEKRLFEPDTSIRDTLVEIIQTLETELKRLIEKYEKSYDEPYVTD